MMEIKVPRTNFHMFQFKKDSEIRWLGKIPKHWDLHSLKIILTERNEKNSPIRTRERLSLSIEKGITLYGEKTTNLDRFKDDFEQYKLAHKGDLVFNSMNMIVGAVGVSAYFGCVSPVYYTFYNSSNNSANTKFYEYLFRCKSVKGVLFSLGKGLIAKDRGDGKYNTLRLKVGRDDLRSLKLPFPPIKEQNAIANFLDDKTAKIDLAIAQKEKMTALLKERKQIIIQNAVTGKVVWSEKEQKMIPLAQSEVEVKDSGVEWIGEIPEDWEVKRLRNVFRFTKGLTITKDNLQDEGIPCVNYGEIHSKYGFEVNPNKHELKCVSEEYLTYNSKSLMNKGDFVFADTSEDIEGSGNFTYLNYKGLVFAGYHTVIAKPITNLNSRFFAYMFDSSKFRNQVRTKMKGVKVFSVTQSILKGLKCWLPPSNIQQKIVEYLDSKSLKIDQAISLQQTQIQKLKEYKSTLIDSAVTGKIKVPGI